MTTDTRTEYIAALIDLHCGHDRQGPGDSDFSRHILSHLPTLPLQPLIADGWVAVISELSWFTDRAPDPAIAYWQNAYPMMGTDAENINWANRSGFSVLSTHRLPSQAWWVNYYEPLRERMQQIEITTITRWRSLSARQSVIDETEAEMRMFERFSDSYGYTFYILQAV
jgi:serine/threonine-protein kinase HipA